MIRVSRSESCAPRRIAADVRKARAIAESDASVMFCGDARHLRKMMAQLSDVDTFLGIGDDGVTVLTVSPKRTAAVGSLYRETVR